MKEQTLRQVLLETGYFYDCRQIARWSPAGAAEIGTRKTKSFIRFCCAATTSESDFLCGPTLSSGPSSILPSLFPVLFCRRKFTNCTLFHLIYQGFPPKDVLCCPLFWSLNFSKPMSAVLLTVAHHNNVSKVYACDRRRSNWFAAMDYK